MEATTNGSTVSNTVVNPNGRRFSRQQRQELLKRFARSGLTQRQFAAREKLGLSTLNKWLRRQRQATQAQPVTFQEVLPLSSGPRWAAELVSPRHWTLRLAQTPEPLVLEQLLRALPC